MDSWAKFGGKLFSNPKCSGPLLQTLPLNLHDVWRVKNPQTKSFTWSQKSPFVFCRLDYWLISNSLQDLIKDVDIIAAIKTDHSAILLRLQELEECKRGPGF